MSISSVIRILITSASTLLALAACTTAAPPAPVVGMANPASLHCLQRGGTLEIVKGPAGERGMCHLVDGTVIEEWELFRREHPRK
ncbi:DUF333 domain-containing protein [Melaminivora sp.]|uniref:putative hemolysin n=1 Tax=Melaminivora sp. TaxID=1933032 RepID=UPI0028AB14BA|nr:DUF333 domain-containing protein [Melaminivora sp.]